MISRLIPFCALATVAMGLLGGCSGAGDRPPLADIENAGGAAGSGTVGVGGSSGADAGGAGPVAPVCTEGETQKCKVKLPSQSGVNNCFVGIELCEGGQWGPCSDPSDVQSKSAPGFGGAGGAR
jgi:hypothetical protein